MSASTHVSAANTLTLLIKASATVTVYRGHRRTLFFLPGINSLFIMCVGIIRNNSLVGGHVRAEARTPAAERVTLYCTWRPSALTTGPPHWRSYKSILEFWVFSKMCNTPKVVCNTSECNILHHYKYKHVQYKNLQYSKNLLVKPLSASNNPLFHNCISAPYCIECLAMQTDIDVVTCQIQRASSHSLDAYHRH